jgi:hypothetical protein
MGQGKNESLPLVAEQLLSGNQTAKCTKLLEQWEIDQDEDLLCPICGEDHSECENEA